MTLVQPDTEITLPSGSASAGRTTFTYGNALIRACENLKEKLFSRAALMLMQENTEGFAMISGGVRHLSSGNEVPLSRIAAMMNKHDKHTDYSDPETVKRERHHYTGDFTGIGVQIRKSDTISARA